MSGVWQLIDRRLRWQVRQKTHGEMIAFPVFQFAVMLILNTTYLKRLPFDVAGQFSTLLFFNCFAVVALAGQVLSELRDDPDTRQFLKLTGIGPVGYLTAIFVPILMQLLRMLVIEIPICFLLQTFGLSMSGMLTALALFLPLGFLALCYGALIGTAVTRSERRSALPGMLLRGALLGVVVVGTAMLVGLSISYPGHPLLGWLYRPVSALTSRNPAQASANLLQASNAGFELGSFAVFCVAFGLVLLGMAAGVQRLLDGDFLDWRVFHWRQRWQVTRRPSQRVWDQALEWKEFQISGGGCGYMWKKAATYALLVLGWGTLGWMGKGGLDLQRMLAFLLLAIPLFESATLAAQIVGVEIQEKTLGSLLLLPKTPRQILWEKIRGAGLTLIPSLGLFCVIAVWLWLQLLKLADPKLISTFELALGVLAFGVQYLLYLHIVVAASLDSRPRDAIMLSFIFQSAITVLLIGIPFTIWRWWGLPDFHLTWFLVQCGLIVEGGLSAYFMNRGIPSVVREKVQSLEENPEAAVS